MARHPLPVFLVSLVFAAPALAQAASQLSMPTDQGGRLAQQDKAFLDYAAQDNQAEIQLCLLAEKKAQNPAVKAFARLMVDDHVQVESQLAALVNAESVDVPNGIGEDSEKTMSQLEPLKGADFDREFLKDQIQDHSRDLQRFGKEKDSTQDADVKRFAALTMPVLQQHLDLARAVQSYVQNGKS
jgi:putative membrane protein